VASTAPLAHGQKSRNHSLTQSPTLHPAYLMFQKPKCLHFRTFQLWKQQ